MTANFTRRQLIAGAGIAGLAATTTQVAAQTKATDKTFDRTQVEGTARYFQNCIRSGNLDGALSCFDAEAVYVASPGKVVRGSAEIRKALESLIAMKPNLQAKRSLILEVAGLASLVDEWSLKATLPGGKKLVMTGASSDIMKKQADGTWVYLVDNPYGAAALPKST